MLESEDNMYSKSTNEPYTKTPQYICDVSASVKISVINERVRFWTSVDSVVSVLSSNDCIATINFVLLRELSRVVFPRSSYGISIATSNVRNVQV